MSKEKSIEKRIEEARPYAALFKALSSPPRKKGKGSGFWKSALAWGPKASQQKTQKTEKSQIVRISSSSYLWR